MTYTKNPIPDEPQPFHSQSLPLGDTGDGNTGVPSGGQGISSRPGDQPDGISVQEDESPDEDDEEDDAELDDEDLDGESDDDEEDDDEEDVDEQTDPGSEPGKPV